MKEFSQFTKAPATLGTPQTPSDAVTSGLPSNLLWHFSDTRTEQGRIQFLLETQGATQTVQNSPVLVRAQGPGWNLEQHYASLHDAKVALAWLSQIPRALYVQALQDLQEQQAFYQNSAA